MNLSQIEEFVKDFKKIIERFTIENYNITDQNSCGQHTTDYYYEILTHIPCVQLF